MAASGTQNDFRTTLVALSNSTFAEGYDKGYRRGMDEGVDKGKNQFKDAFYMEGWDDGYQKGWLKGHFHATVYGPDGEGTRTSSAHRGKGRASVSYEEERVT